MHTVRLDTTGPFDRDGLFRFFADHAVPGLEDATAERYARPVRLTGGLAQMAAIPDPHGPGVLVTAVLGSESDGPELERRIRQLFDLDADSCAIDAGLGADPLMAPRVRAHPGIRMPGTVDAEETLFRTLLGQQISVAAARTVHGRLVADLGDGGFPTAEAIAREGERVLRGPAARIASIVGVARAIIDGRVRWDAAPDELRRELLASPGIGPWTVGYLAMRAGHDPRRASSRGPRHPAQRRRARPGDTIPVAGPRRAMGALAQLRVPAPLAGAAGRRTARPGGSLG